MATINKLSPVSSVSGADQIPVYNMSNRDARKMSVNALKEYMDEQLLPNNASNVVYDPAGTNAVQTTVQSKLRESVSVKDFGAVGDGVTDDTAAIQAALAVCKSTGSPLHVGKGRFLITSTILIPTETSIFGVGAKIGSQTVPQTAFVSNSLGAGVWMFDGEEDEGTNYQNTTIKDCAFVCEGSDIDAAYGLRFRGKGCYVERCFFSNNAIGIRNNAVENWYLYNYFNSCSSICIDDAGGECHIIGNHGYGGNVAGGSMIQLRQKNSVIALNKFFGDTNNTDYGIEIWGSHNIIADNVMDNMEVAAYYFNTSNASEDIVGNIVTGSALNSGYNGVANNCAVLMDASSHNIYENIIDVNAHETRGTPSMEHMYRLLATGSYNIDRNHLKGTVNTASVTGSVIEASGANVGSFNKVDIAGYKTVREWEETVSNGGTVNHGLDVTPSFVAITARSNNVYSVGYDLENATSFRFLGRDNTGTVLSSVSIRFRASREYV